MIDMEDLLAGHPMRQQTRPIIEIRPQQRLGNSVSVALEFGRPSLRSVSVARAGKSTADYILSLDESWRPFNVGFLRTICGNPDRHTEATLFRDLAVGLKLRNPRYSTGTDALMRLARAIEEEAGRTDSSTVILSIDNAELLVLDDYNHLARLAAMFARDLRLFFLLTCQTDASPEGSESLEYAAPPHIRGRFFVDRHDFTGLLWSVPDNEKDMQDTNDVALAFREYDRRLRWPGTDGPTFTEAFAPMAYAAGWRLEHQIDDIKREIKELCAATNLAFSKDWLLASFEPFVYYTLVRIAGTDASFSGLTKKEIQDGLRVSAYARFEAARQGLRV
jgi:hypothetical protein